MLADVCLPPFPLVVACLLEIEFHRRLRTQAPGTADAPALHTSCALQAGYESLIRAAGTVTAQDLDRLHARLALAGDVRDALAALDSLREFLGISQFHG
jgi:hypothetical protein